MSGAAARTGNFNRKGIEDRLRIQVYRILQKYYKKSVWCVQLDIIWRPV